MTPFLCLWSLVFAQSTATPHLVFVVADDLGYHDVSWHNADVETRALHRLAREGVVLEGSYVQPTCTPTRTAFLTGRYPFRVGRQVESKCEGSRGSAFAEDEGDDRLALDAPRRPSTSLRRPSTPLDFAAALAVPRARASRENEASDRDQMPQTRLGAEYTRPTPESPGGTDAKSSRNRREILAGIHEVDERGRTRRNTPACLAQRRDERGGNPQKERTSRLREAEDGDDLHGRLPTSNGNCNLGKR
ncbi:unnamed protein product [Darwinula stevensoni]|uniref:Sulfatase N-terminal domain-containing protein n=1 Tax=Darwinula stevensoni TaxID=69355 RepID=A0A7R9FT44_9CRUS|nr:unnamed protein product [Darwinula stevensoni]CAG0905347.1 unnamed protein product [Darwinula stevensoni]